MGAPIGAPFLDLAAIAAAAVISGVAATVGSAVVAAATAAEQQNQNDDPPAVIATEAVVVTHKNTSKNFFRAVCRSFHGIPQRKKGAARRRSFCGLLFILRFRLRLYNRRTYPNS